MTQKQQCEKNWREKKSHWIGSGMRKKHQVSQQQQPKQIPKHYSCDREATCLIIPRCNDCQPQAILFPERRNKKAEKLASSLLGRKWEKCKYRWLNTKASRQQFHYEMWGACMVARWVGLWWRSTMRWLETISDCFSSLNLDVPK